MAYTYSIDVNESFACNKLKCNSSMKHKQEGKEHSKVNVRVVNATAKCRARR